MNRSDIKKTERKKIDEMPSLSRKRSRNRSKTRKRRPTIPYLWYVVGGTLLVLVMSITVWAMMDSEPMTNTNNQTFKSQSNQNNMDNLEETMDEQEMVEEKSEMDAEESSTEHNMETGNYRTGEEKNQSSFQRERNQESRTNSNNPIQQPTDRNNQRHGSDDHQTVQPNPNPIPNPSEPPPPDDQDEPNDSLPVDEPPSPPRRDCSFFERIFGCS